MRSLLPVVACLLLVPLAANVVLGLSGPHGGPPASVAAAPEKNAATAADGDAAAKHAKRTACLKSAKAKKLVGAQKTAFIKECVAAP
jgi:hypothetical protein